MLVLISEASGLAGYVHNAKQGGGAGVGGSRIVREILFGCWCAWGVSVFLCGCTCVCVSSCGCTCVCACLLPIMTSMCTCQLGTSSIPPFHSIRHTYLYSNTTQRLPLCFHNFSRHSSKTILFPRITTIPQSACDATSTVSSNTKFLGTLLRNVPPQNKAQE